MINIFAVVFILAMLLFVEIETRGDAPSWYVMLCFVGVGVNIPFAYVYIMESLAS